MLPARISKFLSNIRGCSSGNATLIMALGMPVLIGGAGLGVDLSQWYLWKRELQFAVDQAAIAGAWAQAEGGTNSTFETRAKQEFAANLAITEGMTTIPAVQLADFGGGSLNSVTVHASASKVLPFSHFLTGEAATISAYAQATFEEGRSFTSCLIATDPDDMGAITIGGSSVLTASCGIAALSTDELAIRVDGSPTIDAGWILAAGGIDPWLKENTDDIVLEYMEGLIDPFDELEPPNPSESQVNRTYSCASQAPTTTADVTTRVQVTYSYWLGSGPSNLTPWDYTAPREATDTSNTQYTQLVQSNSVAGSTSSTSTQTTRLGGTGSDKKYERRTTVTTTTTSNVVESASVQAGDVVPGTYSEIHVGCDTTFAPGVYNIVGGGLILNGQHEVTGAGVMFVLHDGAYVQVNGGSDMNLTAMQASDLISKGVAPADANKLAGMLVFEDRESEGSNKTNINGNAATVLNGTLYFPVSTVFFAGTASVTSQCLMIAARNITLTGTTNMTTFCPAGSSEDDVVGSTASKVRLVA